MIIGTLFAVTLSVYVTLGASGPVPLQSLIVERVTEGHTAQLQCTMRNATVTHTDVRWYRQEPGSHVTWLSTRERKYSTQWNTGLTTRISFSRDNSSNSFILTITNVQPNDTGVYYCTVQGRIEDRGSLLIVNSINGPVVLQSPCLERVIEGHTARLQCTMRNAVVTHNDVHWYRLSADQIMERVLTHPGSGSTQRSPGFTERFQPFRDASNISFILTITNVQPNDTGVYYCSVWGKVYGSGSQLIVDSFTGPVLLQSPSLERVAKGHTARLQCTMRNATVTHTDVHWYRLSPKQIMERVLTHPGNGSTQWSPGVTEQFQSSRDSSSNSFTLTITNMQLSDTGVYYCSVWGRIYGRGSQINITSANVPVLHQSLRLERVTEGHTARLQCTIRNTAVTRTNVHWDREKPGNKMEWVLTHDMRNITQWSPGFTERFQSSREPSNNSFILTITNTQPNDIGVYYCKVWGDISGNGTQLTVTDPLVDPVLIQDPVVSKVAEGETAEFQCAMYNASVIDTDVHWHYQRPGSSREWMISHFVNGTLTKTQGFHDRVQLSRNVSRNSYTLSLVNVTLNDTAVYSCSVWSYIYGAGSQLNVTEESSHGIPRTSDPTLIIGTILGLAVLICIVLLTFYLWKRNLCSSVKDSTQGSPVEDQNAVYENVNDSLTAAGDQCRPGAYRNPPSTGHRWNVKDSPADSDSTYMPLQQWDRSIYSEL